MEDKWHYSFLIILVLTIGSCSAFQHHSNTELEIAKLECEKDDRSND